MKPEIKQILYATDLSENAKHAFSYAADLADKYNATITILYVMENMNHIVESQVKDMVGAEKWEQIKTEKQSYLLKKIQSRIEDFCTQMNSHFESCRMLVDNILIKKGLPSEVILKTAKKMNPDMIVIGSRGHNLLSSALMGGTARKVLQQAKMPVLVIRLPE